MIDLISAIPEFSSHSNPPEQEPLAIGTTKQLNGIFRAWMRVGPVDAGARHIIWGKCIVHLSNPEFSGQILHTSGVLEIVEHKAIKIAETRNSFYALLGPELIKPPNCDDGPKTYLERRTDRLRVNDIYASAAMNADPDCPKCKASGIYQRSDRYLAICDMCCKHNQGWWQLEGGYGADNGRWACKAGCGMIVDAPQPQLEFLPRAVG